MSVADPLALNDIFDADHPDRAGSLTISSTSEGSESRTARTRRGDNIAGGTHNSDERATGTFHIISSSEGGAIAGNAGGGESAHRSIMIAPGRDVSSGTNPSAVNAVRHDSRDQILSPISQFSSTGLREGEDDKGHDAADNIAKKREYPFGEEDPADALRGILNQSGV